MQQVSIALLGLISARFVYQDFSNRTIDLYGLVAFAAGAILSHHFVHPLDWVHAVFNLGYVLLLFAVSGLVVRLIFSKTLSDMIGMGDFLYLIVVASFFEFPTFIIWFNGSIVLALLSHLIVVRFVKSSKEQHGLIPLVGYFAITFVVVLFYETYVGSIGQFIPTP